MAVENKKDFQCPWTDLDNVSNLKIIDKLVLKLLISRRVSRKYGVLLISYKTTWYFNPASQGAIQWMLPDWTHV